MSFQITSDPLEHQNLNDHFESPSAGAFASFDGRVRDHNDGHAVVALEYEAQDPLCQTEAEKIFQEARKQFDIIDIRAVHRVGRLKIGEMAVWVGVLAAHRDDAFKACRYVIDELKHRLPIWKKEFYQTGNSEWINCQSSSDTKEDKSTAEQKYYEKQMKLQDIGPQGQQKLKETRVLVVGAGGLGTAALMSLATSGFGTIGICEFDNLEVSNVHRQPLYNVADAGRPKVELASRKLKELNPAVSIIPHAQKLDPENIGLVDSYDIILDCTDNFETKFLLNDACYFQKKTLVQASIYQFEGQLRAYRSDVSKSCLRCLWPEVPEAGCVGTCVDAGVVGTVPQVLGHLQAWEAMKIVCGLPGQLKNELLIFDLTQYQTRLVQEEANPQCPLCGDNPTIRSVNATQYKTTDKQPGKFIDITEIPKNKLNEYVFVDIRESFELLMNPIQGLETVHAPMSKLGAGGFDFKKDQRYLIFCEKGIRSEYLVNQLHSQGLTNTFSINGGTDPIKNYIQN